ncbi:bZIP transcription factor [Colletotrichum karsti]|uniref:BZIP transcription factor n=1 Tax=Colletotrichum karsti TaxID=1095194 RepID=A0A9P6I629_9PEZI|nr:bZIP transcription factor [Colletotrichum karsti]KAF9876684.1 bZIP transcription factor [Colletotrichum karsti]
MSSNGPSDAPTSAATPGGGGGAPAKVPSEKEIARKLRKRELDRRAQRQARERTRNRIAELEAQVKELRKDDSTRLSACMEQLATVSRDRDRLSETLKVIQETIRDNMAPSRPAPAPHQQSSSSTSTSLSDSRDASSMMAGPPAPNTYAAPMGVVPETPPVVDIHAFNHGGVAVGTVPNGMSASSVHAPSVHAPSSTSESQDLGDEMDDDMDCHDDHDDPSLIVPPPEVPCDCVAVRTPAGPAPPRVNVWRAVNQVLAKRCRISQEAHVAEDASDEDVPVRALLEGWDAVAKSRPLSKLWKKLRRVDELCFSSCPKTERLAILRTMHLLLQYHSDPTPSRYAKLPTWYLKRPSQAMPHSYAIDFFVWPGVRERFVFGQHHYCNNSFWELFGPNFHLLWPYEFRDTYKKSLVTGQYQISPMFEDRFSDINSWTMGMDFFTRFPELIADIPVFQSLSQSLTPAVQAPTSPTMPQQASLVQLKERDERELRDERMLITQHETTDEHPAQDVIDCSQAMQVYPNAIYSMAAPAFMDDFIPHGYDVNHAAAPYGHMQGYY